jgi:hypothetical protein
MMGLYDEEKRRDEDFCATMVIKIVTELEWKQKERKNRKKQKCV